MALSIPQRYWGEKHHKLKDTGQIAPKVARYPPKWRIYSDQQTMIYLCKPFTIHHGGQYEKIHSGKIYFLVNNDMLNSFSYTTIFSAINIVLFVYISS